MSLNLYKNSLSIVENITIISQSHLAVACFTKIAQGTWAELTLRLNWEVEQKQTHDGDAGCSDDVIIDVGNSEIMPVHESRFLM